MGKIVIFIFVIFLTGLALFALDNKENTTIKIPFDDTYEISKIGLILLSSLIGMIATFLIVTIRDTKRYIGKLQYQRAQKKEARLQELYSKALNALLAHNEEEAKQPLENILKEDPQNLNALLRLGDIACGEDNNENALIFYNKAYSFQPENFEALFSIEKLMEKTGNLQDAMNYIEKILSIDPDNLRALYRKRNILEKNEKWNELVEVQREILKHEHTEKERQREQINLLGYKYEYGRYCLENGDIDKAKKNFKTLMRMDNSFTPAYLGLAEAMLREGESEEAIDFLLKSYNQTSSLIILVRLEDLLVSLGEPSRLIRFYQDSIAKNPYNHMLRFLLGKLYYRLEMVDDALDIFAYIDSSAITLPELYQIKGDLYLKRNQCERAASEFKKALNMQTAFGISYWCSICGYSSYDWSGRCPNCKNWNTFNFNVHGNKT
jgi:lipopolysaccharide biosynthesis regulator YciM